ncbi:hypothetical protein SAMN05421721_1111 [Ectothiorhodospira mobilis]|uniref:Uncharacterized protein n=1 Tax=Ectothiorhodospira mobilis TaxID=195064 RepID=A0A1I4RYC3_ECTMO|nr:hypothetical protein [Ectothiorhodospira mobilis]SFM57296.1 hypothetical protein SAMN05421721_1111 [Ectothiorhodospira mobilis]
MTQVANYQEYQQSPVADPYSALIAIIRPIINGLLYSIKQAVVAEVGGYENVKLMMLPRLRREGDGDIGICFEYAVHDAIRRRDALVIERIYDALTNYCGVPGTNIESILFGAEKNGSLQLIDTAHDVLTEDSRVLTGARAQPPKLRTYLSQIAQAFRLRNVRDSLPRSIKGLWKADLFLGYTDSDRWIGATVKTNPLALEGAEGLRLGIVPAHQGRNDLIKIDQSKNLVVCPVPYDGAFMEVFYYAWGIVAQFLAADAKVPREAALPSPLHRQVAAELESRRDFPIVDIVMGLDALAQPHLLANSTHAADVEVFEQEMGTDAIISPMPSRAAGV